MLIGIDGLRIGCHSGRKYLAFRARTGLEGSGPGYWAMLGLRMCTKLDVHETRMSHGERGPTNRIHAVDDSNPA